MINTVISNMKYIILIVSIVIILIGKIGAKLDYLSIKEIIINHIKCFKTNDNSRWLWLPILNYNLVPILLGISATLFKEINTEIINIITVIMSILTAMLFTTLTMVIDMKAKINSNNSYYRTEYEISKKAIIETYYTVMYEIVISIIILIACLLCIYIEKFYFVFSLIIYSLSFLPLFNLFMIIKRLFKVINTNINK